MKSRIARRPSHSSVGSISTPAAAVYDLNDADWSCVLTILVEQEARLGPLVEDLEEAAAQLGHPAIFNIRRKDFKEAASSKHRGRSSMGGHGSCDRLVEQLRRLAAGHRDQDLRRVRGLLTSSTSSIRKPSGEKLQKTEDDMPRIGPTRYYLLTRFYESNLPEELLKAGAPLIALLELCEAELQGSSLLSRYTASASRIKTQTSLSEGVTSFAVPPSAPLLFWSKFYTSYQDPKNEQLFANLPLIPLYVKDWSTTSTENRSQRGLQLLNQIRLTLTTLAEDMRHFSHLAKSVTPIETPSKRKQELSLCQYKSILDPIPLECTDIELILHSMLEQVVTIVDNLDKGKLTNHDKCEKKRMAKDKIKTIKDISREGTTIFINHKDKIRRKTFHIGYESKIYTRIHSAVHKEMPYAKSIINYPLQDMGEKTLVKNYLGKLYKIMKNEIDEETFLNCVRLLFLSSVFGKTPAVLPKVSKYHKSVISAYNMSVDDLNTERSFSVESKREIQLIAIEKILKLDNCLDELIVDYKEELFQYCFCENMSPNVMLQALHNAFICFGDFRSAYCELSDSILLGFQNPSDFLGSYRKHEDGYLLTMIGFRDYYFLKDKFQHWFRGEMNEIRNDEDKIEKSWLARNEPKTTKLTTFHVPVPTPVYSSKTYDSDEGRQLKVYSSLGKQLVKVSETTKRLSSADGAVLTVKKTKWCPYGETSSIQLNSHGHLITFHRILENFRYFNTEEKKFIDVNKENGNENVNFHIQTKQGIIFSVQQIKKIISKEISPENDGETESLTEKDVFDFVISLPNGLKITLIRSNEIFLRQKHLSPLDKSEEDYRLFCKDGSVIIFMKNGEVIILYPNTTKTRITYVRWIRLYIDSEEEEQAVKMQEELKRVIYEVYRHEVTCPNGSLVKFAENHKISEEDIFKLRVAMDNALGLFIERTDGTKCFINREGLMSTSFPDSTIISSRPFLNERLSLRSASPEFAMEDVGWPTKQTENTIGHECPSGERREYENDPDFPYEVLSTHYTTKHPHYMPVEYCENSWTIQLPFDITFKSTSDCTFEIHFDERTKLLGCENLVTIYTKNPNDPKKDTRTHFYLFKCDSYDNVVCSCVGSDGVAFYGTRAGLCGLYNWAEHEEVKTEILPEKLTDDLTVNFYSESFRKNRNLNWDFVNFHGPFIERNKLLFKPKNSQRFFFLERDLSGCEFVHKLDNAETLAKYSRDTVDPEDVWSGYHVTKLGGQLTCQRPILKTWSEIFFLDTNENPLLNSGFRKCDLSPYLPKEKLWLFDVPSKTHLYCETQTPPPMPYEIKWTSTNRKVLLTRFICDVLYNAEGKSCSSLFQEALKKFNEIQDSILNKCRRQVLPDVRTDSEVEEAKEVFEKAKPYLQGSIDPLKLLPEGESPSASTSDLSSYTF